MTRLYILTATALALAHLSTSAEAQRGGGRVAGADRNGDGVVTRDEWRGSEQSFRRHDWNDDGVLSGEELRGRASRRSTDRDQPYGSQEYVDRTPGEFARWDDDRDGRITREEWPSSWESFREADRNNDGVLTRDEFNRAAKPPEQKQGTESVAYRAGVARGLAEGRAAGREDRERRQGWDLEGQRELEQADSGYSPPVGSREEYQAGYRAGFRRGYPEGYGPT
jgi:hypothetical protein